MLPGHLSARLQTLRGLYSHGQPSWPFAGLRPCSSNSLGHANRMILPGLPVPPDPRPAAVVRPPGKGSGSVVIGAATGRASRPTCEPHGFRGSRHRGRRGAAAKTSSLRASPVPVHDVRSSATCSGRRSVDPTASRVGDRGRVACAERLASASQTLGSCCAAWRRISAPSGALVVRGTRAATNVAHPIGVIPAHEAALRRRRRSSASLLEEVGLPGPPRRADERASRFSNLSLLRRRSASARPAWLRPDRCGRDSSD